METERLQKILATAGYGSRRACEQMIVAGRVTVDGRVAQVGDKADPATQRITVDEIPLRMKATRTYVLLNKPRGVISTTSDPENRPTVTQEVGLPQRLYPVGRLDTDSEGLILLTDDGELTQRLTHPRYRHPRVYDVLVAGEPTEETLERWQRGITLDGKPARFRQIEVTTRLRGRTWLQVTVYEGRNHLVRRIAAALGHPTIRLIRVAMGPLRLGDLTPGRWRYLTPHEIKTVREEVGLQELDIERVAPPVRRPQAPRRPMPPRDKERSAP